MELLDKMKSLTAAAKFDVACTSSGVKREGKKGALGKPVADGLGRALSSELGQRDMMELFWVKGSFLWRIHS